MGTMKDIKTAAQALVDVFSMPGTQIIEDMRINCAVADLKEALERNRAVDEIVKHDQDNEHYDVTFCQSPCPKFHKTRVTRDLPKCDGGNDCGKIII